MNGYSGCRRDVRPTMDSFSPTIYGDIFSTLSLDNQVGETYLEDIEALKKEARSMLMAAKSHKQIIILIDTLERLGLAYHFETEIEDKLQEISKFHANREDKDEDDLFTMALELRLLRQHQYNVSSDIFKKFIEENGSKFKESYSDDVEGLMSLYEAAHVGFDGEDILEEALAFTIRHLNRIMLLPLESSSLLRTKVNQALEQPLHKGVPIIQVRHFISVYETDQTLLKLAKMNFNFLQCLYKKEISELSRWWNKFDLKSKLPYIRDRLIECYIWGLAFHFEPQYKDVRFGAAKSMQMCAIMNDTYDNYATLEEAQLFTHNLERWDADEIDRLPDYMKIVYHFIMSIYEDYEWAAAKQEKSFAVSYFREAVKQLGRAYNQKVEWVMEGHIPSYNDYFAHSVVTSCVYVMFTAAVLGLKSVTKQTLDWMLSEPTIVISTATMGRILDDVASYERENKGGKMLTVVDYYMKYYGLPEKETLSKMAKKAEDCWKDLNTEWVAKTSIAPKDMVEQFLNYARATEASYKNGVDGFTNPECLATEIIALFKDPMVI